MHRILCFFHLFVRMLNVFFFNRVLLGGPGVFLLYISRLVVTSGHGVHVVGLVCMWNEDPA